MRTTLILTDFLAMKNTIYPFLTWVAAAAALVSCSKEETEVVEQTGFVYRFELVEGETKATLDDQGVWWEAGQDHVGIIVDNENILADVVENGGQKEIQFTSAASIAPGTPIYAYYPYSVSVTSATGAHVLFATEQEGGSVSAMPMAGIPIELESAAGAAANGRINFLNLGAIIDFRVYSTNADYANETVESVTFWSDSEEQKVSGTADIDLTGVIGGENPSAPAVTLGTPSYRRATVTQSVSVAASKEGATTPMYLVVAPGTFTSGKIVVNTNAASYTFTYTNKSFARNSIKKFSMNLGSSSVEREAMTKTYTKVNSLSEGTYLLGAYDSSVNGVYIALFPTVTSGYKTNTTQIIDRSSSLSSTDIAEITTGDSAVLSSEIDLQQSGSNWLVKVRSTGMYLYCPDGNYTIGFTSDAAEAGHSASGTNCITYPTNLQFYHSGSEHGFTYYTGKGANNLRFYKLSGSSKSQTISFEGVPENGFEWDLASTEAFVEPTLVGAKTTVVYESSNPTIAEVDSMTGEVTFGTKTGTVTITATAAGEDGYASAAASYEIHVTNSNAPVVTYYKASVADSGYDYIIVSNGNALVNSGDDNVPAAIEVNVSAENTISLTDTEGLLWRVTDYNGAPNYGNFTLTNNGVYLYRKTSNNTTSLICESTLSANYVPWRYDGEHLWNGNSTLYYAYYNNGWIIANNSKPNVTTLLFTVRLPQTLSFSATEKTYDLYTDGGFDEPVLSGNQTDAVTYSSSNSAIATVDASSGAVTFTGKTGTVTITATAASSAQYQSASASYTISIVNSNPNVTKYQKVTSTADLEPGAKYLLVFEGLAGDTDGDGNPKVFSAVLNANGDQFAKATSSALDVTIANGVIESSDFDNCQFTLEAGYYLKGDQANKYIYPGSVTSGYSTSSVMLAESTASHQLTIAFNNGIAEIANGGRYLVWSTSSHYFSCNTEVSGQSSTGICLYKLYDSRQAQTLVFTGSEAKYDLGIEEWTVAVPTVSGNETFPLTWTSSDETVATVDASGNVSPIAKGTTIITATAPANETYKSGSASFTVTVFNSNVPTYYKVDEIENGKPYIIVSNGYALVLNGTTVSASAVGEGDAEGEVKFDASSSALWTATVDGTSVKVQNGVNYLRSSSRSASFSIGTTDSNNAIVYSSEDNTVKVGNYYLNYSGSSFSLNNSATNTSAAFYSRIKPLPSLKFDKSGVTYDLAINDWTGAMPVLSPADADVSYGYNGDDGIIKSISATGVITLEDNPEKGQVTVTATANTPGDYNIASASYTITVIDSNEIPTYTKVSEITSGATYLIVSTDINNYNGKGQKRAFAGDTSGSAVEVDGSSGTITGDYSACEFVITAEGEAYALNGPNGYVTGQSSTDPYIQVSETKVTMSLTDAATLKATDSSDGLVTDAFYFYYLKVSSTEALYLNTNGKFKIGGSGRKYGVYLYKKND